MRERDEEIQKIARSIQELSDIFKELAVLVIDQGTILDRIDFNMEQASSTSRRALSSWRRRRVPEIGAAKVVHRDSPVPHHVPARVPRPEHRKRKTSTTTTTNEAECRGSCAWQTGLSSRARFSLGDLACAERGRGRASRAGSGRRTRICKGSRVTSPLALGRVGPSPSCSRPSGGGAAPSCAPASSSTRAPAFVGRRLDAERAVAQLHDAVERDRCLGRLPVALGVLETHVSESARSPVVVKADSHGDDRADLGEGLTQRLVRRVERAIADVHPHGA